MRFKDLSLGACFKGRKGKVHRKNSPETYLDDGVGPEVAPPPGRRVRPASCPISRTLIELGNAKKKR